MNNLKIGIITQARVGSTRLPGKTLLKINGMTLLEIHLRRLLKSNIPTFLATTTEEDAYKLIEIADKLGVKSKIGSIDDVLSRFYLCAKENNLDIVVRVTSDCPLIFGDLIKKGVEEFQRLPNWENSYFSNTMERIFPRGLDFEIFSFKMLEKAYLNCLDMKLREHVTPYLYSIENRGIIKINMQYKNLGVSDWRLCVDTKEDLNLIEVLFEKLNVNEMSYEDLVRTLEKNIKLKSINAEITQKTF